jgi:hypothetical protein
MDMYEVFEVVCSGRGKYGLYDDYDSALAEAKSVLLEEYCSDEITEDQITVLRDIGLSHLTAPNAKHSVDIVNRIVR